MILEKVILKRAIISSNFNCNDNSSDDLPLSQLFSISKNKKRSRRPATPRPVSTLSRKENQDGKEKKQKKTGGGMDIDLRLPSGEHDKEDEESNGIVHNLDGEDEEPHDVDGLSGNMVNIEERIHTENEGGTTNPEDLVDSRENMLEPLAGMEFESLTEAYAFYQEYAKSAGFSTAIQNSRRSKSSRELNDAKFACTGYGTKCECEKSEIHPHCRQGNLEDSEKAIGRITCVKIYCKASMHVKRIADGKWIIHEFEKEHNHELLPAQALSEQTRKMYAAIERPFAEYKNLVGLKNESRRPFEKSWNPAIEVGEMSCLLEFFTQMQIINNNFFYAIEVSEDQRLKNFFWIDGKSRYDYANFCDVVAFDTTYVRNRYKMPLALFIGVNQHYQFMLLGCALVSDDSDATYSWVMRTWLKAVGGQPPKTIITDQDMVMKSVVSEIFPSSLHFFFLWHIVGKVTVTLNHVIEQNENFMAKFEKCIYRSRMEEEFEKRWLKLVDKFELKENELMQSLYEDRTKWVPMFLRGAFLAGMSTVQRSESVNSFFDRYLHKKTAVQEFVKQYDAILQAGYEEEVKSDSDTWNKQAELKSPSPFEKHAASIYTHAVFKKFQVEVLGAVACFPKRERQEEMTITFKVQDCGKNQEFFVTLNELKSEVSCACHLFEYKGFLCRHAMAVLQICGTSTIPSQYILKRWTKDAKSRYIVGEVSEQLKSRVQRYDELGQRAMKLIEEGSLSQKSYNLAIHALDDAVGNCISANNSNKNLADAGTSTTPDLLCIEEDEQSKSMGKTNEKNNPTEKRKIDSDPGLATAGASNGLQQMDKFSSRPVNLVGYFGPQPGVQGMVQQNLTAPARDNSYAFQQTIQGLGHLNAIPSFHGGYYGSYPTIHGLGQMHFFRAPSFTYGIPDQPNIRSTQLHDGAS